MQTSVKNAADQRNQGCPRDHLRVNPNAVQLLQGCDLRRQRRRSSPPARGEPGGGRRQGRVRVFIPEGHSALDEAVGRRARGCHRPGQSSAGGLPDGRAESAGHLSNRSNVWDSVGALVACGAASNGGNRRGESPSQSPWGRSYADESESPRSCAGLRVREGGRPRATACQAVPRRSAACSLALRVRLPAFLLPSGSRCSSPSRRELSRACHGPAGPLVGWQRFRGWLRGSDDRCVRKAWTARFRQAGVEK
jgi:hypothetical protein